MLILTRKAGQGVQVGSDISVVVVNVQDNSRVCLKLECTRPLTVVVSPPTRSIQVGPIRDLRMNSVVQIGEDVFIQVTKFDHGVVSLGFEAPAEIKIRRNELREL